MSGNGFRMSPYKPTQSEFRMLAYNATESNGNITVHPPWNFVDEQALPSQRPQLCSLLGISDQGVAEGSSHIHYTPAGSDDDGRGTVRIDGAGQPVSFTAYPNIPHDQVGFRSTGQSSQVMIWGTVAVSNGSTNQTSNFGAGESWKNGSTDEGNDCKGCGRSVSSATPSGSATVTGRLAQLQGRTKGKDVTGQGDGHDTEDPDYVTVQSG